MRWQRRDKSVRLRLRRSRFQRRRKQRCGTKRNFHTETRRNEIQTYHRITTPAFGRRVLPKYCVSVRERVQRCADLAGAPAERVVRGNCPLGRGQGEREINI